MTKKSLLRRPENRWRTWLIAAAIAAVALFGALSIDLEGVYADEYEGTVYFNLSHDGKPVVSDVTGDAMMMVPVSLQDVADVDLAEWGYEEYAYTEYGGDGTPDPERPTALKLYLYMHEHYKDDPQNSIAVTQSPQSAYMTTFWGFDENLNYYINGAYPLFEEGWGATCDAIALEDGDRVDVMHFSDWNFLFDSYAGFNYFADANSEPEDGEIVSLYEAKAGEPLDVQVVRAWGDLMSGGGTAYQAAGDLTIHVSDAGGAIDAEDESDRTLTDGRTQLTFDEPGEYYIWVDGGEGENGTIVQSAAAAKVLVTEGNSKPKLAPGVNATENKSINLKKKYKVDLSKIFTDSNEDQLTYKVSVNNAAYAACDKDYVYTPSGEGTVTLKFKANDGQADSDDTYTVNLTVSASVLMEAEGLKIIDDQCRVWPLYELADFETAAEYEALGNYGANYNPIYKLTLPSALDFRIEEDMSVWSAPDPDWMTRNIYSLKNYDLVFEKNDYESEEETHVLPVDKSTYQGTEFGGSAFFNTVQYDLEDLGYAANAKVVALEVYGAWTERMKNLDYVDAYHILIDYDSNAKPLDEYAHELTKKEQVDATCTTNGTKAYWKCSKCGKMFADAGAKHQISEPETIAAGHDWDEAVYEWSADNKKVTATHTCKREPSHVESETAVCETRIGKNPTCEEMGKTVYTAIFENSSFKTQTKTVDDIDALGHDWSSPEYTWADDNSKVTAERVCSRNDSHKETETVEATSKVTQPTCEENGKTTYTSGTFENEAFEVQTKTIEGDSALGHTWGEPEWTWADDFSTAKAKFTCGRDDTHVEEKNALVTSVKKTDAREYTAKVIFDGETYTDTKTKTIEETEASVDILSQSSGGFLHAPQFGCEVSSKKAESYGYQDDVDDGVSALDVLVAAHELVFGDDFTSETAEGFLAMSSFGSPNMQFGVDMDEAYGGFFVNHALPNDGTMRDDDNWNGTTVSTQKVKDGDLVEFFFYEDPYWGDTYNWFTDAEGNYSRTINAHEDSDLELTLKGFYAMQGSMFKDEAEMTASDIPDVQGDVQLYTVDLDSGKLTEIKDAVTDEDDGTVTLNFDEPGTYTITAYGTEDCMFTQIMSLTTINVAKHSPVEQEESKEATYSEGAYVSTVTKCSECGRELGVEKTYTSDSLKKQAEDALTEANGALEAAQEALTAAGNAQADADDALAAAQAASEEVPNHTGEEALACAQAAADAAQAAADAAQAAQEKAAAAVEAAQAAQEKAAAAVEAAQAAQAAAVTESEMTEAANTAQAAAAAVDSAGNAAAAANNAVTAAATAADNANLQKEYADADLELAAYAVDSIMDEKTNAVVTFAQIAPLANEEAYTKASYDKYAAMLEAFNETIESKTASVREVKEALYNVTMAFHNLVAKSPQALKAETKDASTDYAVLSKAAKTFNLVAVSGNEGKLSYSLAEGSSAGLSIDPETGAVTIAKGKNAGTYNAIITVDAAMTDDFSAASETVKAKITVAKVKQAMTVKANTKTVKAAKLKKAKQAVKGTITVKNAKGKVTYAKKSGSAKLTISKKGVVTVKKGTKKGTYKIKVNVKAAGNVNYKAAAKVVTVTVKVK